MLLEEQPLVWRGDGNLNLSLGDLGKSLEGGWGR